MRSICATDPALVVRARVLKMIPFPTLQKCLCPFAFGLIRNCLQFSHHVLSFELSIPIYLDLASIMGGVLWLVLMTIIVIETIED